MYIRQQNIHYWKGWLFQFLLSFPAERKCMCETVMKYFCLSPLCFMLEALDSLKDDEPLSLCCPESHCQFCQHSSLLRSVPLVSDFSFLRPFWGKCDCSTHSFYLYFICTVLGCSDWWVWAILLVEMSTVRPRAQMCSGDGLQSVIPGECEAKMELWNMALPPFVRLCVEQTAGTQTFLCLNWGAQPVSPRLYQELKCCGILLPVKVVFIQSCQKTCCKEELNFIVVLG